MSSIKKIIKHFEKKETSLEFLQAQYDIIVKNIKQNAEYRDTLTDNNEIMSVSMTIEHLKKAKNEIKHQIKVEEKKNGN